MADYTKRPSKEALFSIMAIPLLILFWDVVLPTNKMETQVLFVDEPTGKVQYLIPLSGGGTASCEASPRILNAIQGADSVVIHTSALLGFCSVRLPDWPVDTDLLVQKAISFSYRDRYATLSELRQDYPGFTPELRLWREDFWLLTNFFRRYSIRMPKELVIFSADGEALFTRRCGTVGGYCETVEPLSSSVPSQMVGSE
ncbi:hypothetical protein ACTXGQ_15225 [Marinobacter sp. 1Y8]